MPHEGPLDTVTAASRIGLAKSTLEKLRHYGGGPRYLKLGRLVRYRVEDLDAWLQVRLINSTSECPPAVADRLERELAR